MVGAIVWLVFLGVLLLVLPWGTSRNISRLDTLESFQLVNLRKGVTSTWVDVTPGMWAFLSLVGAGVAFFQGRWVGLIWIAVAAELGLLILVRRRQGARLLAALGDRGRVEPSENDLIRGRYMRIFGYSAAGLFLTAEIIGSVFGSRLPEWAAAVYVVSIALIFPLMFALLWATAWVFKSRNGDGRAKTSP